MRKLLKILFFLVMALSFSCDDQAFIVECSDCTSDEPVTAVLSAKLDPDLYYGALVQIWEGNLEDSILLGDYTAYSTNFVQEVAISKKYTITATYNEGVDWYVAVDSATPRVKYDKSQCDEPCYFVYDRKCDLRLKYTK